MKLKSLLFGSAAVIAAGTGAQAADLPTVEPVEYVRVCDAFGTGFFYIPGTDTCLKIGGYVRAESHFVEEDGEADRQGVGNSAVNTYSTRVRGHINFDARTQTDFGLIRAYIALEGTRGPNATTPAPDAGPNEDENAYDSGFGLASAFIQISNDWGTYTAGKFGSFFDFWGDYGYGTRIGIEAGTEDPNLFAWTFAFGNGFSATVSAEDPDSVSRRRNGDDDYEGLRSPDVVGNIRVDQGWGSAQIMGVIHPVHDVGPGDDTSIGWAVGGGLSLGIPGGWTFSSQAGYTEGAMHYISADPGGMGDLDGAPSDDLNTAWSVRAGVTGPIMQNVNVWAAGSFVHAEEDDGSDEYDFWGVVVGGAWEPAPGLTMGPEFAYNSLDWTANGGAPDGPDYDVWGVMWRVQRSF